MISDSYEFFKGIRIDRLRMQGYMQLYLIFNLMLFLIFNI